MGIERGKHFSGRAFAGATFLPASGGRLGAVPHPHQESLHVRFSHTPGRRHHGREWAIGGTGDFEGRKGGGVACPNRNPPSATSSSLAAATNNMTPLSRCRTRGSTGLSSKPGA